jgi:nitrite reductase/ring-hydroxylating ferredoxin subunit
MPNAEICLKDLPLNAPFRFEKEGMKIVLVRTTERVYAFEDVCPHAFWPLSAGIFHDGILECPGHAWEFQVQTGNCQESPDYCLTPVSAMIVGDVVRLEWEVTSTPLRGKNSPQPQPREATVNKDLAQKVAQFHE